MIDLSKNKVGQFAKQMQTAYDDESILSSICNVTVYSDKLHDNHDFIQIGKRTNFPVKIIREGMGMHISSQMTRSVAKGETRHIMDSLSDLADQESIYSHSFDKLSIEVISEAINQVDNPDHIFFPMVDEYWEIEHEWSLEGIIEYRRDEAGRSEILTVDGKELEVHWLHPNLGIRDVYILNSDQVKLIQKRFNDAPRPEEIDPTSKYDEVINKHPLMLYIGSETFPDEDDSDFPEKVEIVYRVVLSPVSVEGIHSACRLVSPDDIELTTTE